MSHRKIAENVVNSQKLLKSEVSWNENTTDRQLPIISVSNIPQMELLKVNYVHQCKEAIMHKPKKCLSPPRRLDKYGRPPYELKSLKGLNITSRPMVSKLLKENTKIHQLFNLGNYFCSRLIKKPAKKILASKTYIY